MLSRIDELALIARTLAADDRRAFARLVEEAQPAVRRFLLNLTSGDAALADDLAQDTFIKAWTSLSSFRATSRFRTWVTAIALRVYYSWLRSEHPSDDIESIAAPAVPSAAASVETSHDVAVALSQLAPIDRSLVLLFYFEDFPVKKISRVTGLGESNIKTRLHRAKARMAQFLSDNYD